MADLERLRIKGLRQQAAREAVVSPIALTVKKSLGVIKNSPAVPTGPNTVPAAAQLLRDAARMPRFDENAQFARVATECVKALARKLQDRYSPQRAALSEFTVYDPSGRQEAALKRVREFIADMETALRETRGLVLYGSVGTGKDHLLAAALYHVASAGIPVAWVSGEDIYAKIRDSMDSGELEAKIIQPLLRPLVLGISDPVYPTGELGDWDKRVLARLLDQRYRALRPTWLTMNATDEADAKGKLTSLIWDRFQEDALIVPCFWQSFRQRRKAAPG
jgi:DNA replication protein DnaC